MNLETKYNYESIKALAKSRGVKRDSLLALTPQNDPFYCGSPYTVKWAEWFTELWQRFGFGQGVHLRRVHYRAISQDPPILKPDGEIYKNTMTDWQELAQGGKYARYLKMVDYDAFVDRKAPEPLIFTNYDFLTDPEPEIDIFNDFSRYELPGLPELPALPYELPDLPGLIAIGYDSIQQDYHVEIWIEKSTMNNELIPICRKYGVNLVTGVGELSLTSVNNFMKRVNKPARILYISDFDPKGLDMPVSIARKIEYYQRNEGMDEIEVCLQPIILTQDQVEHYKLPKSPIKPKEKLKAKFEDLYGEGAVELDSLAALYPGEFERIVEQAILQYFDPTLVERALDEKQELQDDLDNVYQDIRDGHDLELQSISSDYQALTVEFESTRQEFAKLVETFRPQIEIYHNRLAEIMEKAEGIYNQMEDDLENVEIDADDYPLPEAEVDGDPDNMLYSSSRDYFSQLEAYKRNE